MIGRLILKVIGVLTLVSISIVALAGILLVGWFLLAIILPNRMNVTARVCLYIAPTPVVGGFVYAISTPVIASAARQSHF